MSDGSRSGETPCFSGGYDHEGMTRWMTLAAVCVALSLLVSVAGCGGSSGSTGSSARSVAGIRAAYQAVEADIRAGRYNDVCARFTSAALAALSAFSQGRACTTVVAEGVAGGNLHVPHSLPANPRIVITGNRATVYHGGEQDKLLYVLGRWEFEVSAPSATTTESDHTTPTTTTNHEESVQEETRKGEVQEAKEKAEGTYCASHHETEHPFLRICGGSE
jgi:hypothetical protein